MASRALVLLAAVIIAFLLLLSPTHAARPADRHSKPAAAHHRKFGQKTWAQFGQDRAASGHRKLEQIDIISPSPEISADQVLQVDVLSYGATGDGESDDTPAVMEAWASACSSSAPATLVVPKEKTFLLKQIVFSGQCNSTAVTFKLDGKLVAPATRSESDWGKGNNRRWIMFSRVDGLTLTGDGTIDGSGEVWWKSSCRVDKNLPCTGAPTALLLHRCNNLTVENIRLLNSQQMHVSVEDCEDVVLKRIKITAPGDSPNTDGIHIARTKDVQVIDCDVGTGDDCVSIETGTENLFASGVRCGPGHGISIGSLGDDNSEARVSNITIRNARLSGTTNGARIKSWQGGRGYARDITYEDLVMEDVKNPIILDQNYCTMADPLRPKPCEKQGSAVAFSGIRFKNIRGTSATKQAIKLDCSDAVPCHDILLQDVKLTFNGRRPQRHRGGRSARRSATTSLCNNVELQTLDNVDPKIAC